MSGVGTLLGGVVAGGGVMTPAAYREFLFLDDEQQVNFKHAGNPVVLAGEPRPVLPAALGTPGAEFPAGQGNAEP